MKIQRKILLAVFLFLNFSSLICLQVPYSSEAVISNENLFEDFFRVVPPDSAHLELSTKAWLWHDDKNLYTLVESQIDENFSAGRFADYDVNPASDYIRIQLITDAQNYFAYGYFAYPLGSKYDFIRNSELEIDKYWNSSYSYSTEVSDSLWTVTFKIPFSDLRRKGSAPYHWKIILTRHQKELRESHSSPFVLTKMGNDYFRKAHSIVIQTDIASTRYLTAKPHTIFTYDFLEKNIDFDEENIGLDLTYNPTPTMRTKFSISPDFSDTPLDAVIDTYNSKYPPTYSENRYFFIEDFNVFGVNSNLFYSRNIVQPIYAIKFSGSHRNLDFGFLSARDKLIEQENPDDFYNILSFKPVWQKFRIQFTLLNRMNTGYHNTVLHTRPIWEVGKNKYFWANSNLSSRDLNNNSENGYHIQTGFSQYTRNYYMQFSVQRMSKNYALDMGTIYEDDFYGWNFDFKSLFNFESNLFSQIGHTVKLSEEVDNDSNILLERYLSLNTEMITNYHVDLTLEFVFVKENIETNSVDSKYIEKKRLGLRMQWDKLKWFIQRLSLNKVDYFFYSLGHSYNGSIIQYSTIGTVSKYFSYSFNLDYSVYPEIPKLSYIDKEYILGNFDSTLNFTNRLSITSGIRFHNYERYDYKKYFGYYANFKWEINDRCKLFAGINSEMNEINSSFRKNYEKFYTKLTYRF